MVKYIHYGILLGLLFLVACERPQAPDFKVDHKLQAPLTINKTYTFLGHNNALIDTTSEDYESLFKVDSDGLVRLSKEEEFQIGDLNDAIPELDVKSTSVEAQVGEIKLGNFSSLDKIGEATFKNITGTDNKDMFPSDGSTPIPVNIDLKTDHFESALISKDGYLSVTLTNSLGFDLDELVIRLNAGNIKVGEVTIEDFKDDFTKSGLIPIADGSELFDLNVNVSASWSDEEADPEGSHLSIDGIEAKDLTAEKVVADIESQSFQNTGSTEIDDTDFQFSGSDSHVELSSGELEISIDNNIDVAIEELRITFPEIKTGAGNLSIKMSDIPAKNGAPFTKKVDLSGSKITCDCLNYTVKAVTENTQENKRKQKPVIRKEDGLNATVDIKDLQISRAEGFVTSKSVMLNEDSDGDGKVDLFDEREAEVTEIDGFKTLSEQISNITFSNPLLNMIYETNMGVPTTIYASIAAVDKNGDVVFLKSKDQGNAYHVPKEDIPAELRSDGRPLKEGEVIKFDLDTSTDGAGVIPFSTDNTNISEFFSHMPTRILFVGTAEVGGEGVIYNPVQFTPHLGVDIPINFSADKAAFNDNLEADLSDLPGENDERELKEAVLTIGYTNKLPLNLGLQLKLLDEQGKPVTVIGEQEPLAVKGAPVDTDSRFAEDGVQKDKLQISLSADQLKKVYKTRSIDLDITFDTPDQQEVKIRAEDSVSFDIRMSADITSTVN